MWLDNFNHLREISGFSLDELSARSGVPNMLYGGWSSPQVLQGIYEHALEDKNPELRDKIVNHFEDVISHGISHEKIRNFPGFGAGFIGECNTCRQ